MQLGIQPDLTYLLLARVEQQAAIPPEHGGRRGCPSPEPGPYRRGPGSPLFGDGRRALSGGQREVLLVGCEARPIV